MTEGVGVRVRDVIEEVIANQIPFCGAHTATMTTSKQKVCIRYHYEVQIQQSC